MKKEKKTVNNSTSESSSSKKKSHTTRRLAIGILVLGAAWAGLAGWAFSRARSAEGNGDVLASLEDTTDTQTQDQNTESKGSSSFTFVGVGDHLLHDTLFLMRQNAGLDRNYNSYYELTQPYTSSADISYLNLETPCAGDAFGLSGYPSFNAPAEFFASIDYAGFNWLSLASNHSMDATADGMIAQVTDLNTNHPSIITTGAYKSEEDSNTPVVRDVNGIQVGFASFGYGLNGYKKPAGMDWLIDVYAEDDGTIDYEFLQKKLDALNEASDVQIVSMHWGQEYQLEPNSEQMALAKFLHDNGVDVIIGSHPHVLQTAEIMEDEKGQTLVYYSLGNFISAQDKPVTMVGGMARFTLDYDFDTGTVSFPQASLTPTVTWISQDLVDYKTTTISEYTDELAASHLLTAQGQDISVDFVKNFAAGIMEGSNVTLDLGE